MEILKKSNFKDIETSKIIKNQVSEILEEVRINKDIGVRKYNLQFDKNSRQNIRVMRDEVVKAYKQVYRNKDTSGVDGITVDELGRYNSVNKEEIKEQIRNRKYKPSPVRRVYIPKKNRDKRGIGIPKVVDRLKQKAIVQAFLCSPQRN